MPSPYEKLPTNRWFKKTAQLIEKHPLTTREIVDVVLRSWASIFDSAIGGYKIGTHIFPKPQVMGFFLHELIALEFAHRYPEVWRGEQAAHEKDLVYVPDSALSIEIKTSSHKSQIFGNRSYVQAETDPKKTKSGYTLRSISRVFQKWGRCPRLIESGLVGWIIRTGLVRNQPRANRHASNQRARSLS